ncbi:hypothetical protein [Sphingomonas rubra]|uniref:Membrane-bound lysozyme-inhibitor of c-type lysozyme n=1 Tax=Sphingomonas rubra TaxID=634430 RepID=A0A1I5SS58_9SPHN|nr:hypothetical protein [Sphingomonas rubra]SFP73347.1 hypothetical protein SAMN04488241_10687 [Sphingomonas rubra]
MKSILPLLAAPLCVLAACNAQPTTEVVNDNPDPMATQLANAAPVELPPAIRADKTMRCADGSVIGVVFFQGDKQVNVRVPNTAQPQRLTTAEAGQPYTAEGGWKLAGSDSAVTVTTDAGKSLTCHT